MTVGAATVGAATVEVTCPAVTATSALLSGVGDRWLMTSFGAVTTSIVFLISLALLAIFSGGFSDFGFSEFAGMESAASASFAGDCSGFVGRSLLAATAGPEAVTAVPEAVTAVPAGFEILGVWDSRTLGRRQGDEGRAARNEYDSLIRGRPLSFSISFEGGRRQLPCSSLFAA